jgi:hypothetical protein
MLGFFSSTLSTNLPAERISPKGIFLTSSNLTNANHAIFLSPLLAVSKQAYDARETQAIGRVRRYGQVKHVHIYRFLTMDSVDETLYKERTGLARDESIEGCVKVAALEL